MHGTRDEPFRSITAVDENRTGNRTRRVSTSKDFYTGTETLHALQLLEVILHGSVHLAPLHRQQFRGSRRNGCAWVASASRVASPDQNGEAAAVGAACGSIVLVRC